MQAISGKQFTPKKIVQYVILLLAAAVLLYFCFRGIKWADFKESLKECRYIWIAVSMLCGVSGFILRSLRWRMLLRELNPQVTLKESYDGLTIGNLTNFAVPRIGELVRCGVVARKKKVTFEGAIGTMLLERTWDLVCLFAFVLLLVLCMWKRFGQFFETEMFSPASGKLSKIILISIVVFAVAVILFLLFMFFLRKRLQNNKFYIKIAGFAKGLWHGIIAAFKMKNKWLFFLLTFLLWGSFWLTSMTTILAFPGMDGFGWTDALFLMLAGSLGWAVPVQGGIGAYHFIVSLALAQLYGIAHADGMVFATISHESQALAMIICGTVSLIAIAADSKKMKKNDNTIQNKVQNKT